MFVSSASALSPLCQTALSLPPVSSHYVAQVLDRSRKAIVAADALPASPTFGAIFPDWARSIYATAMARIDVTLRLTAHSLSFEDATPCLAFDTFLLQCEMDRTFDSLQASLTKGSWLAILRKQVLLEWLDDRFPFLLAGAKDSSVRDATWGERQFFDPPETAWCCPENTPGNICANVDEALCLQGGGTSFQTLDACTNYGCVAPAEEEEPGPLCPYHTDYEPPTDRFGCGLPVLASRRGYPPIESEYLALERLMQKVNEARERGVELLRLQQEIEALSRREPLPDPPPSDPPPHRAGFDCRDLPGSCSLDPDERCTSDDDCGVLALGACIPDIGFCELNANRLCSTDDQCAEENLGRCITDERALPVRHVLRGSWSLREDILRLLRRFLEYGTNLGASRQYIDDLKVIGEIPPNRQELQKEREGADPVQQGVRTSLRQLTRSWSRLQAAFEAAIYPRSTDVPLEMANVAQVLRQPVSRLARLSSERTGGRSFVTKYAYYILRSCIFRPCRTSLEHTLKITDADECFPYANGSFLKDTEEDPRWKKCVKDACLRGAGVPDEELPAECEGIP